MNNFCPRFNGLHLHFDVDSERVIVDKCCLKISGQHNWIESYSIKDFLNLPDIFNELDKLKNKWPQNFDKSISAVCPSNISECDWEHFKCERLKAVEVGISLHCNAKCSFCFIKSQRDLLFHQNKEMFNHLETAYFKTLESLKNHNLDCIRLTDNGEPFFFKEKTLNYIKSLTIDDTKQVAFNSNFSLITPDEIISLYQDKESQIELFPVVSLNAWDRESYKRIMGMSEYTFDKVLENIQTLKCLSVKYIVSFVLNDVESVYKVYQLIKKSPDLFYDVNVTPNLCLPETLSIWQEISKLGLC